MSSLLVADEGMAEKTDEVAVVRALGEGQGLRIENVDLLSKYSDWVYLDVSEICIKLLGNVGAEARCWRLLLFVADDLVPENILLRNLLMETKLLIVNQTSL